MTFEYSRGELQIPPNYILESPHGFRYRIIKKLGAGNFGIVYQAFEISDPSNPQARAIKVTKSDPRYHQQALLEIQILQRLMEKTSDDEKQNISILFDVFDYNGHLCIVMELLSWDLYTVLKKRNYIGIPVTLVQSVAKNLLKVLIALKRCEIIHCDIKPENVLLVDGVSPYVKLIDYGSSQYVTHQQRFYIQSRYYRAPEVILGINHSYQIDIWSFGCLLFELFTGIPLFPGQNEFQMLQFIERYIGRFPEKVLNISPKASQYFCENGKLMSTSSYYKNIQPPREIICFQYDNIKEIVLRYAYEQGKTQEEKMKEKERRLIFIDFLEQLLKIDPNERITPEEALSHKFIVSDLS